MSAYIPKAQREDWRTPADVVEDVRAAFGGSIGLDPCASDDPTHWLAGHNITRAGDGLAQPWFGSAFVNPIFSALRAWVEKAATEHRTHGAEVIVLMPARTDTKAWHQHVATASAVCLWRGRMTFVGATASCPFPVALVYWGPNVQRFREVFGGKGMVFRP